MRLHKSLKVWSLYADLEESFGTFKSTKAVYDRVLDLRIATPQIIINYGLFLKENNYFEEAFKAYEKGISMFKWPNVFDIWNTYLSEFLARYGGSKLERTRDLFEQCLDGERTNHKPALLKLTNHRLPREVRQELLPVVRQAGGGAWDGKARHGRLRQVSQAINRGQSASHQ